MLTLSIAARNLLRNARRTVLTGLAIALGLAMMLWVVNLQRGSYDAMITSAVSATTGHIVIEDPSYIDDPDPMTLVGHADALAAALTAALPAATVTQRLAVDGLLSSTSAAIPALLRGVEPTKEAAVDRLSKQITDGEWLAGPVADETPAQARARDRGIILGEKLAANLDVALGARVVYRTQHDGVDHSRLFRVLGIYRTGSADIDGAIALVTLTAARELLGQDDVANQITVHLDDPNTLDAALATAHTAVHDQLPAQAALLPWRAAQPGLINLINIDRAGGDIMMAFLGLIVAMGVLNTVLMSVMERMREFGVMMAIGVRPARLARLVLAEATLLGVGATALGVALGCALTYPMATHGLDYSQFMGDTMTMDDIIMDAVIYSKYDVGRMAIYAIAAVGMTVLSAVYPAWTVLRLAPVDAMRHT